MRDLYDIEQSLMQRKRETELIMRENSLLRQLSEEKSWQSAVGKPALRVRLGLLLIRLGSRLAA